MDDGAEIINSGHPASPNAARTTAVSLGQAVNDGFDESLARPLARLGVRRHVDDVGADDAHDKAVDRIKRAAAQEGVETASCESCGESVNLGLLTAPECPHCEATVSDVRPTGGIFRKKARLVAAAQLESGDEGDGS